MIAGWPERAVARVRALSPATAVTVFRSIHLPQMTPFSPGAASELDTLVGRTLFQARWFTVTAVFLLALIRPLIGRAGVPTWILVLAFAVYNGAIVALRPYVPLLRSFARVALVDLLVVGTLYTMAATPDGPVYILFLLITVCAAATNSFPRSLIYTAAVCLLIVVIAPTLPLRSPGVAGAREVLACLLSIAFASTMTALLVRRLEQEHLAARSNGDKAARQAELNRLRGIFVSSVSHDLRTPLTALRAGLGMVEMSLQDRLRPDEAWLLAAARRNSERLVLLIDDLLIYNQLEAGTLDLAHTRFDLAEVVTEAVSVLQPLLDEKGQQVTVDLAAPLPAEGDPRRLELALVNVLANAHQHTPARTHIHIASQVTTQELLLTVHDDGPGIPAEELERVFQRFHRLAPAGSGSGLGLAIARSIVERHGGRVWAESTCGKGTSLHLALPRCKP